VSEALPAFFWWAVVTLSGLCLGSFATALAWRLPRGISMLSKARSSCTSCGADLGLPDLVPLFSWLALKGKCRRCGARIGMEYPLIEAGTLALCLVFFAKTGVTLAALPLLLLAPVLAAIVAIDLRHKTIPDVLNLSAFLLALLRPIDDLPAHLAAALLLGGGAWLLRFVFSRWKKREAMGLGDVKFMVAAGVWIGPDADALALFLMLSGVLGAGLGLVWRKYAKDIEFPFGPALALALVGVLAFF
jgi:leader peptidase (prepilin peptidase) / N-methyltransferase